MQFTSLHVISQSCAHVLHLILQVHGFLQSYEGVPSILPQDVHNLSCVGGWTAGNLVAPASARRMERTAVAAEHFLVAWTQSRCCLNAGCGDVCVQEAENLGLQLELPPSSVTVLDLVKSISAPNRSTTSIARSVTPMVARCAKRSRAGHRFCFCM